jgi:hypothetical protein
MRRALFLVVLVSGAAVTLGANVGSAGGAPTNAAKWAAGDCFSSADVDADEVVLSSKVACSKEHTVQVTGGAALPASLASAGRTALVSPTSAQRPALIQFAAITCNAGALVPNVYKKLGKQLQRLMLSEDVTEFVPSSLGHIGWVLPDATSFAAGATDLICVFEPTKGSTATTSDVRELERRQTLPKLRLCRNFRADNSGADRASCAKPHDQESLIYISQLVTGKPANVSDWQDADYASYDAACSEFAKVIIGADRGDLLIRGETDPAAAVREGRRLIDCIAYTKDEKVQLPAGTLVGVGKAKIKFPNN